MAHADFAAMPHEVSPDSQNLSEYAPTPPSHGASAHDDQRLISRLIEAEQSPAEIASEAGMSLAQFARWTAAGNRIAMLEMVARLADIRARLLLSQFRANAVIHLIRIATAAEPSELSRKACVDLIEAGLDPFKPIESEVGAEERNPFVPLDNDAILHALERLAQQEPSR